MRFSYWLFATANPSVGGSVLGYREARSHEQLSHSNDGAKVPAAVSFQVNFRGKIAASCYYGNYNMKLPTRLKLGTTLGSGFSPFLSTLWQATTATKTAMVITALRRAQNQNRRHPEIIMVGSAVVITRIIPRSPRKPRGQTFRRLRHRPVRRRRARRSSLWLHLPQHHKRQRGDLFGAAAKRISLPLLFSSQKSGPRDNRTEKRGKRLVNCEWSQHRC